MGWFCGVDGWVGFVGLMQWKSERSVVVGLFIQSRMFKLIPNKRDE